MRAHLLIRSEPHYRRSSFEQGLRALGYDIAGPPRGPPAPGDLLVIWNRYGAMHQLAFRFEQAGGHVIVAENGVLGRDRAGEHWYSLTLTNPLAGGLFRIGGPERWDSWNVKVCDWRKPGKEIIILAQRGIGPPGVRQPDGWERRAAECVGHLVPQAPIRIRAHPGERPCVPLDEDLANAYFCVTWASGAAVKALLWGIPVVYGYEQWIAREAACPMNALGLAAIACRRLPSRLPVFHGLAWSTWATHEIESGAPFQRLLALPSTGSTTTTAAP